jgi:hypothetical protein
LREAPAAHVRPGGSGQPIKVFCFFFSKKK